MIQKTFLLVHGPWHGAWCWRNVVSLLQASGHLVFAPDLPGDGQDKTPLPDVTFRDVVDRIGGLVDRGADPVILVGHSLNAPVISQVAEEYPDKIAQLIYLAALVPYDGESVVDMLATHPQGIAMQAWEKVAQGVSLRPDQAETLLYHDCPSFDARRALKLLRPQAEALLFAPVTLTERYERVPRASLLCTQDRMISLAVQQQMASTCDPVVGLPSGHCPFLSMPERLAECLLAFAGTEPLASPTWERQEEPSETRPTTF